MRRDERPISEIIRQLGEMRLSEIDAPKVSVSYELLETMLSDELDLTDGEADRASDATLKPNQPIRSLRELGSLLRMRRKQLGYTQEELAESLGCSPRLVRETEQGRPTVGFERVMNHAMNLGVDLFARVRGGGIR